MPGCRGSGAGACAAGAHFDERAARRDLDRYRSKGPDRTTDLMAEAIRRTASPGATLLDVGGGVGVLHHELLGTTIERVVHVEASSAYVEAARDEDARRGRDGRIEYLLGDAAQLGDELPPADVVTLDRVICCYPDSRALVRATADRALDLYAFSIPRNRWFVRLVVWTENLYYRVRGKDLRVFVHPLAVIEEILRDLGFREVSGQETMVWDIRLFRRDRR